MHDQTQIGRTPPMAGFPRETLAVYLMGGATVCAYLWDFRTHGIRVFDAAGLTLLSVALFWQFFSNRQNRPNVAHIGLTALFVIYCAYSFFFAHHKSSIAIAAGAMIFLGLATYDRTATRLLFLYKIVAVLSIVFFLVQMVSYTSFEILIDPHVLLGEQSRVLVDDKFIRPAGFFQEPASYCLAMFMLISLITAVRPAHTLTLVTAFTMLLSQSLWGWGAAICTVGLYFVAQPDRSRKKFVHLGGQTLALLLLTLGILFVSKPAIYDAPPALRRITQVHNDPSLKERYIQNNIREIERGEAPSPPSSGFPLLKTLMGNGMSTHHFLYQLPANGLALIWKAFGALGTTILIFTCYVVAKPMRPWRRITTFFPLVFVMTNYPTFSYLWFWMWLAAIITINTEDDFSRS